MEVVALIGGMDWHRPRPRHNPSFQTGLFIMEVVQIVFENKNRTVILIYVPSKSYQLTD